MHLLHEAIDLLLLLLAQMIDLLVFGIEDRLEIFLSFDQFADFTVLLLDVLSGLEFGLR